jgi:hypothetical protein
MVTKVGRRGHLLICSDCGRPVEKREQQLDNRRRLYGALSLIGLSLAGGMIFFLASMDERLAPGGSPSSERGKGSEANEEGQRLPEPALLAPEATGTQSMKTKQLLPSQATPTGLAHGQNHGSGRITPSAGPLPAQQRSDGGKNRPEP